MNKVNELIICKDDVEEAVQNPIADLTESRRKHDLYDLIDRAIESAKCRIYRIKSNPHASEAGQKKDENQKELMDITIKALEFYRANLFDGVYDF